MNANGKLTNAELTTVIGGRLSNATAAAWNAMVAAAAHDGVALIIAGAAGNTGSGAYRDYWTQNDMRVHPALYGLSSYSTVTIARAGYSTHGLGTSLDIGSFPPASRLSAYGTQGVVRRSWVLKNAESFGFTRTFGESDPNHFGHDGSISVASESVLLQIVTPTKEEDTLMKPVIIYGETTGAKFPYLYNPYTATRSYLSPNQLSLYRSSGDAPKEINMSQFGFDSIPKTVGLIDHDGKRIL